MAIHHRPPTKIGLALALAAGACLAPPAPTPPAPPLPHPDTTAVAANSVPETPLPTAEPLTPPPAPAPPPACPDDMVLVEGDYCTEVEHHCLVEWWAPQNRKRVCEQFEPFARCVGQRMHKRYCIDRFEYPNQRGVRPEVMNTFYQAEVKCAALGRRMCTESEWSFACEGPDMKPFPYGFTRDPRKCNGDHRWDSPNMKKVDARDARELARLWRGVPSGSQPACVSDFGVFDLPGNADEVCAGESPKAKFASVNTGGPWYSGVRNQCRPKVYTHGEDFFYYFLSFRCCAAPDGGPNEPRTASQVKKGTKLSRIEQLAGFTVDEMRDKRALKAAGTCDCKATDRRCKTMCGTLLGPNAVDGSDATRVLHRDRKKIRPEVGP